MEELLNLAILSIRIQQRGGGVRGIECRHILYDEPGEPHIDMVVLHILFDCVDAMGANMVNTLAERLSPHLESITGERVGLRILSNYATHRLAKAECRVSASLLGNQHMTGERVVDGIVDAIVLLMPILIEPRHTTRGL